MHYSYEFKLMCVELYLSGAIFLCTISKCLICQNPCKDQPQW